MYKDQVASDTGNKRSFSYCFVSKNKRNKTGEPDMKSSGWKTPYFIHGKAPRSGEKRVTDDTTAVVTATQKLVIKFDEARYQIWPKSKATKGKSGTNRRFSLLVEGSRKAARYL